MKQKTIVMISAVAAYCYLFYQQYAGINVLIFNLILITGLYLTDTSLLARKSWLAVAAGALITAVGALLYGNFLSCSGNVFALLILANLSVEKEASLAFAFLQSMCSYATMPFMAIIRLVERPIVVEDEQKESGFTTGSFMKIFLPLLVLLVFFLIYKGSNPVFSRFIDQVRFDISWQFVWFLVTGSILLYGFFYQYTFEPFRDADLRNGNRLTGMRENEFSAFSTLHKEYGAAIITFVLLNLLLLLVNILDIQFIFSGNWQSTSNYSEYVHQGINSSIFSVVVAILVTLYFFRGNLNFMEANRTVKRLAIGWIVLNMILLATCLHKNMSYIHESGLTYKRIGVYFYLFLTFIGLVTTWIKISGLKSNMFLVRVNAWSVFITLTLSTLFNWNRMIMDHNIQDVQAERLYYLFQFPETSIPYLVKGNAKQATKADKIFTTILGYRKQQFMDKYERSGWQSWNLEHERIFKEITRMEAAKAK